MAQAPFAYVTQAPWCDTHDHTLVLRCSDPRYKQGRDEYLQAHKQLSRVSEIALPGGPAIILLSSPTFFTVRPLIAMLHKYLEVKQVFGFAHRACAYYREKYPRLSPEEVYRKQIADLFEFEIEVAKLVRGARIELYYEDVVDAHVGFKRIMKA